MLLKQQMKKGCESTRADYDSHLEKFLLKHLPRANKFFSMRINYSSKDQKNSKIKVVMACQQD